ncbi:MAG TPA: histidine kinase dimerization/phospho-acceptor domain-containing protein [Candidatus Obscuribacterales bacterium]
MLNDDSPRKEHGNKRCVPLPENLRSFISHELRAPLACVEGALRLMSSSEVQLSPYQKTELISVASNGAQQLTQLVDKLLDESSWAQLKLSNSALAKRRNEAPTSNTPGRPIQPQTLKVLMVDDDHNYYRFVRQVLEQSKNPHFELRHVGSVGELKTEDVIDRTDVILLDLTLPDSFGPATVTLVRTMFPRLPIVVLTGTNDEDLGVQMVADGADDYLVKHHINDGQLLRSIQYAVTRKGFEESTLRLAAISDFTNAIAHDLTVPLTGARNVLSVLAGKTMGALTPAQDEMIRTLQSSTDTLLELLEKLLEAYRYDLMSPEIPFGAVDLSTVLEKAMSELLKNAQATERKRFIVKLPGELLSVQGNPDALERLLFNLLENALVHGDDSRPIRVDGKVSEAVISINVHNWGPPIPTEVIAHTFGRLWHGIPGKRYVAKSGVGLYLAQRIARLHGGKIVCQSNQKDGTTMTVQLPVP